MPRRVKTFSCNKVIKNHTNTFLESIKKITNCLNIQRFVTIGGGCIPVAYFRVARKIDANDSSVSHFQCQFYLQSTSAIVIFHEWIKSITKVTCHSRLGSKAWINLFFFLQGRNFTVSMAASRVSLLSILRRSRTYIFFLGNPLQVLSIRDESLFCKSMSRVGAKSMLTVQTLLKPSITASM